MFIAGYLCFRSINSQPVQRWDEQTNISVINDTEKNKSFPVLYLGHQPFFEKPPLWYYLNLLFSKFAGLSIINLRIFSAASGFVLILSVTYAAYRLWGVIPAIMSALVLIFTNQLFVSGVAGIFSTHNLRSADLDALFILLIFASSLLLTKLNTKIYAILAGITGALAVLTKGPEGLVPIIIISIFNLFPKKYLYVCWLTILLLLIPWYLYMTLIFGGSFIGSHFGYHLIARSFMPIEGHSSAWWFYLYILSNPKIYPFGIIYFISIILITVKKIYLQDTYLKYFLILSVAFIIVPTVISTKLAWYILPVYPFSALVISGVIFHLIGNNPVKKFIR